MIFNIIDEPVGLCVTCQHGQVMDDVAGRRTTWCYNTHPALNVPVPLAKCNEYEARGRMSRYDAEKIGWVLEFKKGAAVGFRPPKPKTDE